MKMFKRLTWFLFVALFLLVGGAASASTVINPPLMKYNGAWLPDSDNDILAFKVPGHSIGLSLYDWGNPGELLNLAPSMLIMESVAGVGILKLRFDQDGSGNWFLTDLLDNRLSLGDSREFGISLGGSFEYNVAETPEHDVFVLYNDNNRVYVLNDVTPLAAPIPTALILFGSGLLGLVGLKRKNY